LKATNTDTATGNYPIGQTPSLKRKKISFFEDNKNGPTIITLLPPNHRIGQI